MKQLIAALSIKQPWAWLIVNGYKDIENRNWKTEYRGQFIVQTGSIDTRFYQPQLGEVSMYDEFRAFGIPVPKINELQIGGIVGMSEIVDCVDQSPSLWFTGKYGFVLQNSRKLPFEPAKGMPGFFKLALSTNKENE